MAFFKRKPNSGSAPPWGDFTHQQLTQGICHLLLEVGRIDKHIKKIMATQEEQAATLQQVATTLDKIGTETSGLLKAIEDLKTAASQASPELQAAVAAVADKAAAVDNLVADAPPVDPGTGPTGA